MGNQFPFRRRAEKSPDPAWTHFVFWKGWALSPRFTGCPDRQETNTKNLPSAWQMEAGGTQENIRWVCHITKNTHNKWTYKKINQNQDQSREVDTFHLLMSKRMCNSLLFKFKVFCKERNNSAMGNTGPNSLPSCKHTFDFTKVAYLLLLSNLGLRPVLWRVKASWGSAFSKLHPSPDQRGCLQFSADLGVTSRRAFGMGSKRSEWWVSLKQFSHEISF